MSPDRQTDRPTDRPTDIAISRAPSHVFWCHLKLVVTKRICHISQMVSSSLTKVSDIFYLVVPLNLSLFGAKSHVWVSHRRLLETGVSRK